METKKCIKAHLIYGAYYKLGDNKVQKIKSSFT
jgi:hypothetical protein